MGVGRFFCVGLPLVLTIASVIALLVATLSGVTHNSLYIFRIDVTKASVDTSTLGKVGGLINDLKLNGRAGLPVGNITASNVGVDNVFDVTLWGYCTTFRDGRRECTRSQFDWASKELNTSLIDTIGAATGGRINLPKEVQDGLTAFKAIAKWTAVAFVVAIVALVIELVVGVFASCSRAASCLTWFTAGIAAILVGIAAGLATAMATVVVGTFEALAGSYGVKGHIGGRFLAAAWIAFAFALSAAFFWLLTICCCKPEHRGRKNVGHADDGKKLIPRGYAALGNETQMSGAHGLANAQHHPPRYPAAAARTDLAYEPYSHRV